jgi:XTP/dITP diphosphohydrolase
MRLVLASANRDKVSEMEAILQPLGIELLPRPADVPDVIEDADSLEGNARLKAVAIATATGAPALADDTGLEVDALDGAPGVRSARYAGPGATYAANVDKLLCELDLHTSAGDVRSARFRTVVVVRWPDGRELVRDGVCEGSITHEPQGSGGFGYDPVFVPDEGDGRTFAEMSADEKHAISHRGRAIRALADALREAG